MRWSSPLLMVLLRPYKAFARRQEPSDIGLALGLLAVAEILLLSLLAPEAGASLRSSLTEILGSAPEGKLFWRAFHLLLVAFGLGALIATLTATSVAVAVLCRALNVRASLASTSRIVVYAWVPRAVAAIAVWLGIALGLWGIEGIYILSQPPVRTILNAWTAMLMAVGLATVHEASLIKSGVVAGGVTVLDYAIPRLLGMDLSSLNFWS